jgi:hypothetical protein
MALLLGVMANAVPMAWAQSIDECHAKAAFLFNFAKFVEWPSSAVQERQGSRSGSAC